MRWLFHIIRSDSPIGDPYAPPSLAAEGFIHCSYRDAVRESARLHFPDGAVLSVLQIDPRSIDVRVEVAETPRGPMPHVHGPIPARAIVARLALDEVDHAPDHIDTGHERETIERSISKGAPMERLTLYLGNKNYSSWSLRPWLALERVGVAFEEVVIPLDRAETRAGILAQSPSGRVPALRHGELVVWDSLAICEYLAERFPAAQLWPAEVAARATARSVSAEMHSGFAAMRSAMTMNIRRRPSPIARTPEVQAEIDRVVAIWTDCRRRFGRGGAFLFGDFSIADAMYAPVVTRMKSYAVPLEGAAAAYADAVWEMPSMMEWRAASAAEPWSIAKPTAAASSSLMLRCSSVA